MTELDARTGFFLERENEKGRSIEEKLIRWMLNEWAD